LVRREVVGPLRQVLPLTGKRLACTGQRQHLNQPVAVFFDGSYDVRAASSASTTNLCEAASTEIRTPVRRAATSVSSGVTSPPGRPFLTSFGPLSCGFCQVLQAR
jgi:hypothetical protein